VTKGLCGRRVCRHICTNSNYCELGKQRVSLLLAEQVRRRQARKFRMQLESEIPLFVEPFPAFQERLNRERARLAQQLVEFQQTLKKIGKVAEVDGESYQDFLTNYKVG